jgi:hypothetical protein
MPARPPERGQHRAGRAELLARAFTTFEEKIRDQLGRMMSPAGFDPARELFVLPGAALGFILAGPSLAAMSPGLCGITIM